MTDADRDELGRVAYEAGVDRLAVKLPHFANEWERQHEPDREMARRQAEAVARKVLGRAVARLRELSAKAHEMKMPEAAALLLRGVANELQAYLDAPAEGRADA